MASLDTELDNAKLVLENLKRELKHWQKKVLSKDNYILDLKHENEYFATTVYKNKGEITTLISQTSSLQKKISPKTKSSKSTNTAHPILQLILLRMLKGVPYHPQEHCAHTPQSLKRQPQLPPATFSLELG